MNSDIRQAIKAAGLHQWEVAKQCGITEFTFIRWLRFELTEQRRKAIFTAIKALSGKGV